MLFFMFDTTQGLFYVSTLQIDDHVMLRSFEKYEATLAFTLLELCGKERATHDGLIDEVDALLGLYEPCPACEDLEEDTFEISAVETDESRAQTRGYARW